MKNILILLALAIGLSNHSFGQGIEGDWEGSLDVQGTSLKIVFHIVEDDGAYSSTMDSPNQGAFEIKMDKTTVEGNKIMISNNQMSMETIAEYDVSTDAISGVFKQGPMELPLKLSRVQAKEAEPTNNHPMAGDWHGELDIMGTKLRLIFHLTENEGMLISTMDSPDQNAFGMTVDSTTIGGNEIVWIANKIGMRVEGEFVEDSSLINGTFSQSGQRFPVKFTREEIAKKEVIRPQEPKTFDYIQEEVKFVNKEGGHALAGTLTIPKNKAFDKAVILVSGSGPQDRNEELLGHKPFLVISDYLTRNGVAVLRYDDRGVAESEGDFKSGTSMDFADDAVAAVEYLRSRDDMKGKKIGVMGHSEGGLIAPIVTTKTKLDFIVLLAGPGINSIDLLLEQSAAIAEATGASQEVIKFNNESSKLVFDFIKDNQDMDDEELKRGISVILKGQFDAGPEELLKDIKDVDAEIENQANGVTTPWFRYFLAFDPEVYLSQVTIPTLAVNGSLDLQVLAKSNLAGIEKGLLKAGNTQYAIKEFDGLNHLFQHTETGSPTEYGEIEETFSDHALKFILEWVSNFDQK